MNAEALARIHARAMQSRTPWTVRDFADLVDSAGVFLTIAPLPADMTPPEQKRLPQTAGMQPVAGFALGRAILDEVELLTLVIDPAHQRLGLGRACLDAFEAEAVARGAIRAFLEVSEANQPARALYHAAGWTETGRRTGYYRTPEGRVDAVLMSKPLDHD